MKKEAFFGLLVVAGYIALEGYAAKRAAHRMEPLFIFDQFIRSDRAVEVCGGHHQETLSRFERNLEGVRRHAVRDLAKSHPEASAQTLEAMAQTRAEEKRAEVDAEIAAEGCDGTSLFAHRKRFGIWANKRVN